MKTAIPILGIGKGLKFLRGQQRCITWAGRYWRDHSEKANFLRSKYIPGNGPHHRLGKALQILGLAK